MTDNEKTESASFKGAGLRLIIYLCGGKKINAMQVNAKEIVINGLDCVLRQATSPGRKQNAGRRSAKCKMKRIQNRAIRQYMGASFDIKFIIWTHIGNK